MLLFAIAVIFALAGVLFFIIDYLSNTIEIKSWGMLLFIAAAADASGSLKKRTIQNLILMNYLKER